MNAALIVSALLKRRSLRTHEAWNRPSVSAHRARALTELRRFANERSPFYRRFHRGYESCSLEELPVLTKSELMASFDEVVTDRSVRRSDIERHLSSEAAGGRFRGRYWVTRTAGSTGHPGVFLANGDEWSTVVASYARAQEWAGIRVDLLRRTRLAVVSSRLPSHQSALVGASVDSPFVPVLRLDATEPVERIVSALDPWQPENLVAYASMARVLADEQIAGRLHIQPRAVMCASEPLTPDVRRRIRQAWGVEPFNVYAATETAGIASECSLHRLHLFEDLVISEVVDEHNRLLPPGVQGAKILVTVLFSRTQPLIRYEMSDTVTLSTEPCSCGLPFGTIDAVDGRAEDVITLPGADGHPIRVHPNVFHRALEALPVEEWQVIQEATRLRVLLARPTAGIDGPGIAAAVLRELRLIGAVPPEIFVENVAHVERTSTGKAPLVRALREPLGPDR